MRAYSSTSRGMARSSLNRSVDSYERFVPRTQLSTSVRPFPPPLDPMLTSIRFRTSRSSTRLYKLNRFGSSTIENRRPDSVVARLDEVETPLDMTHCHLRAMSPIHVVYIVVYPPPSSPTSTFPADTCHAGVRSSMSSPSPRLTALGTRRTAHLRRPRTASPSLSANLSTPRRIGLDSVGDSRTSRG
jgi:hypothetical protein